MAAGSGDDAECASIAASFLDFEVGPRLVTAGRPAAVGHGKIRMGKCVIDEHRCSLPGVLQGRQGNKAGFAYCGLRRNGGHQCFVAIADHGMHAGQTVQLQRRPLSVAAGDHNASGGIFPVHSPEKRAGRSVSLRGHAAGVGDNDIGVAGAACREKSALAQLGADHLAIRTAGPAAEVFDVVFCHAVSLEQLNVVLR